MSAALGSTSHRLPRAWQAPLLALAAGVLMLVLLYGGTLMAMVGIWERSGTFAHCYLVAPISLWLIWRRWGALKQLAPRPDWVWALPMAVLAFVWLLGDLASINALTQFAFTALLVLMVPLVLGRAVAAEMLFPLAFLFFMVPFGEFLLPVLMEWTADFTVAAVRLSGIPVYREGLQFIIPTGTWSVVEACSGVRYLIASIMVGSLFAYLNYNSMKRRLLFCLVALLVPLLANWLRAYMIVMLGHLSGNKLAVGVDHLIYGWVFFGLVIGLMFYIGSRWAEAPLEATQQPVGVAAAPAASGAWQAGAAMALAGLLLASPHVVERVLVAAASAGPAVAALDLKAMPGLAAATDTPAFVPKLENPTATASGAFQAGGGTVHVHVGYYRNQGYGRKLVSSENVLVKAYDTDWQLMNAGVVQLPSTPGPLSWRQADVLGGSVGSALGQRRRFEVRQIYWSDGEWTSSNARATAYAVRGRLLGRGDDAAMDTVYTEGQDRGETSARLNAFIQAHLGSIDRQLVTYRTAR